MKTCPQILGDQEKKVDAFVGVVFRFLRGYLPSFLPFLMLYTVLTEKVSGQWNLFPDIFWAMVCHLILCIVGLMVYCIVEDKYMETMHKYSQVSAVALAIDDMPAERFWFLPLAGWYSLIEMAAMSIVFLAWKIPCLIFQVLRRVLLILSVCVCVTHRGLQSVGQIARLI